MFRPTGSAESKVELLFNMYDLDGDDQLSREEFMNMLRWVRINHGELTWWPLPVLRSFYPVIYMQLNIGNSFDDWAPKDDIYGRISLNKLPWFECKIGHQDNSSCDGHQGGIACWVQVDTIPCYSILFGSELTTMKLTHLPGLISRWTKWPPIWQTAFSNAFSWMKMM